MSLLIRAIAASDFKAWLKLWTDYQIFYKASIPEAVTRTSFSRMLDPAEPTFGALAIDNGQPLGMVHWILHRSNWSIGNYCYLQDLYVAEQNRGRGIGRALIEHVYAQAASADCSRVYWLTHETNIAAMHLYDSVAARTGFVQYNKPL